MSKDFNRDGYRWVHNKDEMPTEPHYAVMEFSHIYIPGDERSQTHPGHGYPAENKPTIEYIVFKDREHWELYIKMNRSKNIVPVYNTPAKIKTTVNVEVDLPRHSV
jgi:hypothetical protein